MDHKSLQPEILMWEKCVADETKLLLPCEVGYYGSEEKTKELVRLVDVERNIVLEKDMTFNRPAFAKTGQRFRDLRLQEQLCIPTGKVVFLRASNESVAITILGLISGVIATTGPRGEMYDPFLFPSVRVPWGLRRSLLLRELPPPMPGNIRRGDEDTGVLTVTEAIVATGAPEDAAAVIARHFGLDPDGDLSGLSHGVAQVFTLVKEMLLDSDVLCCVCPASAVPWDMAKVVMRALRVWQAGGLPLLAKLMGVSDSDWHRPDVYKPAHRPLIICQGIDAVFYGKEDADVHINIDDFIDKQHLPGLAEYLAEIENPPPRQILTADC